MNCRIASSVCGDVGLAAIELDEAREEVDDEGEDEETAPPPPVPPLPPPPRVDADNDAPIIDEAPAAVLEDICGGWWRSRKRAPDGVRKAEM